MIFLIPRITYYKLLIKRNQIKYWLEDNPIEYLHNLIDNIDTRLWSLTIRMIR